MNFRSNFIFDKFLTDFTIHIFSSEVWIFGQNQIWGGNWQSSLIFHEFSWRFLNVHIDNSRFEFHGKIHIWRVFHGFYCFTIFPELLTCWCLTENWNVNKDKLKYEFSVKSDNWRVFRVLLLSLCFQSVFTSSQDLLILECK